MKVEGNTIVIIFGRVLEFIKHFNPGSLCCQVVFRTRARYLIRNSFTFEVKEVLKEDLNSFSFVVYFMDYSDLLFEYFSCQILYHSSTGSKL